MSTLTIAPFATDTLNWVLAHPTSSAVLAFLGYIVYFLGRFCLYDPLTSPLEALPGPPKPGKVFDFKDIALTLDTINSQRNQQELREKYGKNMRIQGFGFWDQRLLTFDSRAINYILVQATEVYPKAWQSRRLLARLLGEGVSVTEGDQHKRQRRIINPAFSQTALRQLDPIFRSKAEELRDRWLGLIPSSTSPTQIDVGHWVSRATFDAFALGGFSYSLNVIQNEDNELYLAYKRMFDAVFNKGQTIMGYLEVIFPWLTYLPSDINKQIAQSKKIILEAGERIVCEKRMAMMKGLDEEKAHAGGKDLLSVLIKSNLEETSPRNRLSDAELISQIHSFLFVGSDSVSLSIIWTLYELSLNTTLQVRLRLELLAARASSSPSTADLNSLPLLDAVVKECFRVTPPLQSTLRAADRDDVIPTEDGAGIKIRKGQMVQLPLEGMNIMKEVWGEDAWEFKPERWFNLPDAVKRNPGLVSNLMTFSVGSHSCPGAHFAFMEIKAFLAELVCSFEFAPVPKKRILKGNVMVTRPFVAGEWDKGSQLPMLVRPYSPESTAATEAQ